MGSATRSTSFASSPIAAPAPQWRSLTPRMTETPKGKTKVVVADDHAVVRSGLRSLLESEEDIEVVAEAGDVPSALRYVSAHRPKVLVLDLHMPGEPSLPAIPKFREACPETQIVVLTMQNDPAFAREALQSGATGYVLKE